MTEQIQQRIAVRAVIIKDRKVLVIRESGTYEEGTNVGKYDLPGGRVSAGERFDEALRREVFEEVGLEIITFKPFFVGEWRPVVKDTPLQIIGIFFVCTTNNADVVLGTDHDEFLWVGREDVVSIPLMSPVPEALQILVSEGLM